MSPDSGSLAPKSQHPARFGQVKADRKWKDKKVEGMVTARLLQFYHLCKWATTDSSLGNGQLWVCPSPQIWQGKLPIGKKNMAPQNSFNICCLWSVIGSHLMLDTYPETSQMAYSDLSTQWPVLGLLKGWGWFRPLTPRVPRSSAKNINVSC